MSDRLRGVPRLILMIVALAWLAACGEAAEPPSHLHIGGASPDTGRRLIHAYGCGACHVIEGIRGARGTVGPPLANYAERSLLAGILPNTPEHLVPWLLNPVAFDSQSGMPPMGLSEDEARHIAAYLYAQGGRTEIWPDGPPMPLRGREDAAPPAGDPLPAAPDGAGVTPRTRRLEFGGG